MLEREPHISSTLRAKDARSSLAFWVLIVMVFAILSHETRAQNVNNSSSMSLGLNESHDRALLKDSATLLRTVEGREHLAGVEGYYPVHVFVSHSSSESLLRKISVELVGTDKTQEYWFSTRESAALSAGGLHMVATWWLRPGEYQVWGNAVAEEDLDAANIPRINVSNRTTLNIAQAPHYLELSLAKQSSLFGLKETSRVAFRSWEEGGASTASTEYHRRQLRYYARSGNTLQAGVIAEAFGIDGAEATTTKEEIVYSANKDNGQSSDVGARSTENLSVWYWQYQTAIEHLRGGREETALNQLIAIATAPVDDFGDHADTAKLLQDRINTEVGFHFLKTGRNISAAQRLRSVRRFSPYAEKALIGLGWALLRPIERERDGDDAATASSNYLWSGSEDYVAWARRNAPYRNAWSVSSGEKLEDLRNALAPWLELVAGDSLTAEVQEGLLVIPYALTHFGALDKAEERYQYANSQLSEASIRLASLLQSIQEGDLASELVGYFTRQHSGWGGCLCGFEYEDPQALKLVTDEPAIMESIDALRQWIELRQRLRSHRDELLALDTVKEGFANGDSNGKTDNVALAERLTRLDRRLSQRIVAQSGTFNQIASHLVAGHIDRTDAYLAESRFAIARLHERRREQLLGYRQPEGRR